MSLTAHQISCLDQMTLDDLNKLLMNVDHQLADVDQTVFEIGTYLAASIDEGDRQLALLDEERATGQVQIQQEMEMEARQDALRLVLQV